MIIDRHFSTHGHTVRVAVEAAAAGRVGWDIQEELDATIVHREHCSDWHRVECHLQLLERSVMDHDFATGAAHR